MPIKSSLEKVSLSKTWNTNIIYNWYRYESKTFCNMKCWALQKQRNFICTSKKISVPWGLTWKMWITITWTVGNDQMSTHRELESTWSLVKGGVLSLVGHLRLLLVAHHYHLVGVFQIRSFSYTTDIYEYERYNWHIWLKKILKFLDLPSRRDRFCSLLHPYQAGSEGQNIRRVQISCKYREIRAWQIQNTNGLNLPSKQRHEHWCRSDCFVGRWKSQRPGLEPFCLKENCLDYFCVAHIIMI